MVNMLDMLDALIMHSTWNRFVRLLSVIDIDFIMFDHFFVVVLSIFFATCLTLNYLIIQNS